MFLVFFIYGFLFLSSISVALVVKMEHVFGNLNNIFLFLSRYYRNSYFFLCLGSISVDFLIVFVPFKYTKKVSSVHL